MYKALLSGIKKYGYHQRRVYVIDNMMDPMSLGNSQVEQTYTAGPEKVWHTTLYAAHGPLIEEEQGQGVRGRS